MESVIMYLSAYSHLLRRNISKNTDVLYVILLCFAAENQLLYIDYALCQPFHQRLLHVALLLYVLIVTESLKCALESKLFSATYFTKAYTG